MPLHKSQFHGEIHLAGISLFRPPCRDQSGDKEEKNSFIFFFFFYPRRMDFKAKTSKLATFLYIKICTSYPSSQPATKRCVWVGPIGGAANQPSIHRASQRHPRLLGCCPIMFTKNLRIQTGLSLSATRVLLYRLRHSAALVRGSTY